jgi:argininosuccinate lyase
MSDKKLWGGRFSKQTNKAVDDFHSSISFDMRMYEEDILGSIAHAQGLGKQGIISLNDTRKITEGLSEILADIKAGKVEFDVSAEDIHMNIEQILTKRIGEAGKRLHTGRSRNDQVSLDTHIYVKKASLDVISKIKELCGVLVKISEANLDTVMPGFTHMQKAQPITLAFHLMAYYEMFKRDIGRFKASYESADVMPLGSGALASTTFPLDREFVAKELGFPEITQNAMDAVSDRDYVLDFIYASSVCLMHLSRFCEEVICWASNEYGFIELDDAYSTGSSIMPQKKNPDVAELIRGKTGRVYGDLVALLTCMKSLPLAYNKDMQEDKEALFDAHDTVAACVSMFTPMLDTAAFNADKMAMSAKLGYTNATDAADYLVGKGMPFREAHEVIGNLVALCIDKGITLDELPLEEYKALSDKFDNDIYEEIDILTCVKKRKIVGGCAPEAVAENIKKAKKFLAE